MQQPVVRFFSLPRLLWSGDWSGIGACFRKPDHRLFAVQILMVSGLREESLIAMVRLVRFLYRENMCRGLANDSSTPPGLPLLLTLYMKKPDQPDQSKHRDLMNSRFVRGQVSKMRLATAGVSSENLTQQPDQRLAAIRALMDAEG